MSDKQQKIDEKEAKRAAKEALKEKQARSKSSKSKKGDDSDFIVRLGRSIKRFFKDFKGTTKKIVWPDGKTVFKSTLVVLAVVLVVGIGIWVSDFVLTNSIGFIEQKFEELNEDKTTEEAEEAETDPGDDNLIGELNSDEEPDDENSEEDNNNDPSDETENTSDEA